MSMGVSNSTSSICNDWRFEPDRKPTIEAGKKPILSTRKQQELDPAQKSRDQSLADGDTKKAELLGSVEKSWALRVAELAEHHKGVLVAAEEKYPALLDQLAADRQAAWSENESRYAGRTSNSNANHSTAWQEMAEQWQSGYRRITGELAAMQETCDQFFPDWTKTDWQDWQRPATIPPVFPFGNCSLPLQAVKNGISADPRLVPEQTELQPADLVVSRRKPADGHYGRR